MFKNYFTSSWRNLSKHPTSTALNVAGLAAALTCFIFIASWIKDELSYDVFNSKADRIVRVVSKSTTPAETFEQAVTGPPLANALQSDFPEVENTVRFAQHGAIVKSQYVADNRFSKFFLYFSILSLMIACLGLFGLTAFTVQQRVKEIGIRKVLGASVANITTMLSADFLKLLLMATIIAFPIAWYVMYKWLQHFSYRINISGWTFIVSGSLVLIIALITVSFQSIKAAVANPVKSLRTE